MQNNKMPKIAKFLIFYRNLRSSAQRRKSASITWDGMTKKANAYIAFASLFVVLVLILSFGSQLHGWKLWLAILVSVLFAIWAGATIGGFLGGNGKTVK
jgi:hypothetical protein